MGTKLICDWCERAIEDKKNKLFHLQICTPCSDGWHYCSDYHNHSWAGSSGKPASYILCRPCRLALMKLAKERGAEK